MSKESEMKIAVARNGPYLVSGGVPLAKQHVVTNEGGESIDWRQGEEYPAKAKYALCRCGQSGRKPFCDGTHVKVPFDGTETASREPYAAQAQRVDGPKMALLDAERLCAFARFCDVKGKIWNLVGQTDEAEARTLVAQEAGRCPSGRLVALDSHGQALEPALPPSIGVVEDTALGVGGPLWVRGAVAITAADGQPLEARNRVALCRCGASKNKPYCDGAHATIKFKG